MIPFFLVSATRSAASSHADKPQKVGLYGLSVVLLPERRKSASIEDDYRLTGQLARSWRTGRSSDYVPDQYGAVRKFCCNRSEPGFHELIVAKMGENTLRFHSGLPDGCPVLLLRQVAGASTEPSGRINPVQSISSQRQSAENTLPEQAHVSSGGSPRGCLERPLTSLEKLCRDSIRNAS